jgi:hypothetical protein
MNRILLAVNGFFASSDPRFNLCVKGVGFLARQPTAPAPHSSRFVPFSLAQVIWTRGQR